MSELRHRRLRAPQEDGAALIDPPLAEVRSIIERNRRISEQFARQAELPPNFHTLARAILVLNSALRRGVTLSNDQVKAESNRPMILTGHQPELFHPGVWFKNFLASTIAKQLGGYAVNLVIDNDIIRSAGIRVPTSWAGTPHVIEVPFDAPAAAVPWEERRILDDGAFNRFALEVHGALETVKYGHRGQPLVLDWLWPNAIEEMKSKNRRSRESIASFENDRGIDLPLKETGFARLGDCLAAARGRLEQELGLAITDYPLHKWQHDPPFIAFTRLLFLRHREFHEIYNAALVEYRLINHVRSQSHPVPELACDGDWTEVPFWLWTFRNPQRRRAFIKAKGHDFEVSDREEISLRLPADDFEALLRALITCRIKLRPRALITTMYARLVLSDLFIHGIGGAKYDELTDLIIRRFFGIEPPAYLTATATFRLPIERPQVSMDDVRKSARRIRELRYRPEAFLRDERVKSDTDLSAKLAAIASEKREYLAGHDLRRCSQQVFDHLDGLNRAMHDLLRPVEDELRAQHVELIALAKQSQLLGSREYSFVLFPAEKLPARLLDLSAGVA